MRLTPAQRQARYRKRHPEKIAAYKAANKDRQDAEYRARNATRIKERQRAWEEKNKEKNRERLRQIYLQNKEAFIKRAKEWQKQNPEKLKELRKKSWLKWYAKNKNLAASRSRERSSRKVLAMPSWAERDKMKIVYLKAKQFGFEVDHVVPLKHPLVCGLHVWANLQLLNKEENARKKNYRWPDMPVGG